MDVDEVGVGCNFVAPCLMLAYSIKNCQGHELQVFAKRLRDLQAVLFKAFVGNNYIKTGSSNYHGKKLLPM